MPAIRRNPSSLARANQSKHGSEISESESVGSYVSVPAPVAGEKYKEFYLREVEEEEPIEEGVTVPVEQRPPPLTLGDIEIVKTLGKGQEGRVYMARTKRRTHPYDRPGTVYALKTVTKEDIRSFTKIPEHMYNKDVERSKLASLSWYPFVAGLLQVFDDPRNVYMMLEFVPCGTLRSIIQKRQGDNLLTHREAAFYYSNILCGLEFLHANRIAHRDIKPDNILVGQDGYLCLGDFGTAVHLSDEEACWTAIGTPYYSSPEVQVMDETVIGAPGEVLENRLSVDVFSAGCILFEMLTRNLPFTGSSTFVTWHRKMGEEIEWPISPRQKIGKNLKGLILSSLNRVPTRRPTVCEIKKSPWLRRIDWELMVSRRYIPPYVPSRSLLKDLWHKEPLPEQAEVPGISIVEPAPHLVHDNRFPVPVYA